MDLDEIISMADDYGFAHHFAIVVIDPRNIIQELRMPEGEMINYNDEEWIPFMRQKCSMRNWGHFTPELLRRLEMIAKIWRNEK